MSRLSIILSKRPQQMTEVQEYIDELVAAGNVAGLKDFVSHVFSDGVLQATLKASMLYFANAIKVLASAGGSSSSSSSMSDEKDEDELNPYQELAEYAISAVGQAAKGQGPGRVAVSMDDVDYVLRNGLFTFLLASHLFHDAASALSGLNFESTSRPYSDKEKADIFIKCAECLLHEDEPIEAENFVSRAMMLLDSCPDDWQLQLRYKNTNAQVMDANKRFTDAALRYFELSKATHVSKDDQLELLGKAVTCAVLGKSGPQRSRMLGLLYKDERLSSLEQLSYTSHPTVLRKMYTQQIIKLEELPAFESSLKPHQKAMTEEGFTIIEKAVIEHNLLAAGKIYDNIRFDDLGMLLRLDASRAEKVAARMITEERLKATIDQTDGILIFQEDSDALLSWDERIKHICSEVSACVEMAGSIYPATGEAALMHA